MIMIIISGELAYLTHHFSHSTKSKVPPLSIKQFTQKLFGKTCHVRPQGYQPNGIFLWLMFLNPSLIISDSELPHPQNQYELRELHNTCYTSVDTCQREGCQDYSTDMCVGVQKSTGAFMDIGSSDRIYSSTKWCPVLSCERCQSGSIKIQSQNHRWIHLYWQYSVLACQQRYLSHFWYVDSTRK